MAGFFDRPYESAPYKYEPKFDELIERHPDKRRSESKVEVVVRGKNLVWLLEVRGLGAITMRAGSDKKTGRLQFDGVGIFTRDQILFD